MFCNHLTKLTFLSCICKAEFCYVCGTEWRNCNCSQYNDATFHDDHYEELWGDAGIWPDGAATGHLPPPRHLPRYRLRTIFRAERAVERHNKFLWQTWGKRDPRPREEQIQEVREEVENGCDHGYWDQVPMTKEKPGHCKLCKYVGRKYIFQCLFCPLTSCWACHTDEPPEYRRVEEDEQDQQHA